MIRLSAAQLAWCVYGLASLLFWLAVTPIADNDFHAFYQAAMELRGLSPAGASRVDLPSLNPPTFTVLMLPFTLVAPVVGFVVWTIAGIAALMDTLRRIHERAALPLNAWPWIIGAVGATMPAILIWVEGQLVWFLSWLVTRAWLASNSWRAGAWLGLAVAIKPPLALAAVLLPWPVWLTAGALSAALSLATVPLVGLAPWTDWIALGGQVDWLASPHNVSAWGLALRLWFGDVTGHLVSALPVGVIAACAIVLLSMAAPAYRAIGTRRWGLALWWSIAASPAGWSYYLPLVIGPLLAGWPAGRLASVGVVLLALPLVLWPPMSPWGLHTVGLVPTFGVWLLWAAWVRAPSISQSKDT